MNKGNTSGLLEIHTAVLFFGLSGLFGKFLDLPAWTIVLGRTGFAAMALGGVLVAARPHTMPRGFKPIVLFSLLGLLLSIHWITFFYAIQISTVAVGLLTFSTFPIFITLLEPWWFNETLRAIDVLTAFLVLLGLAVMVLPEPIGGRVFEGAMWGTASGFTFAVLSLLNRKWAQTFPPAVIAFYQNVFAALVLIPLVFIMPVRIGAGQVGLLVLLGVVCTALSHTLFIRGLTFVRAQLASIIACLEPVYGIIFAYLLLDEHPSGHTLCGGAVILITTFLAMIRRPAV